MTAELEPTGAGTAGGRDTRLAQFIITIFGLCARAEGNWLSVASVVALMADLGAEGQAVRSSISRLKRRGVLVSERHGGAAGYSLAPQTLEVIAEGDIRIFHRTRATEDDGWVVVVFSVPETEREKRHSLRTTLTRLGFGTAAPGVWVAPGNLVRETEQTLQRRGLSSYVDLFRGRHLGFGDPREKVTTWWDLDELTALYSPTINSYKRYVPGVWAPLTASWGVENRTTAIRLIPGDKPSATRIEYRQTAADMNPYIAMATCLAAGLYGIENAIEPGEPQQGDASTAPSGKRLPTDLGSAAQLLKQSEVARTLLGAPFVEHYVLTREWEVRQYQKAVSDWELKRYFESI